MQLLNTWLRRGAKSCGGPEMVSIVATGLLSLSILCLGELFRGSSASLFFSVSNSFKCQGESSETCQKILF